MKKSIGKIIMIGLAIAALLAMIPGALAQPNYVIVQKSFATDTRDEFDLLVKYQVDGDKQAFTDALTEDLIYGHAKILEVGDKIYSEGMDGFLSGVVKIRYPGDRTIWYTFLESIKSSSSN